LDPKDSVGMGQRNSQIFRDGAQKKCHEYSMEKELTFGVILLWHHHCTL